MAISTMFIEYTLTSFKGVVVFAEELLQVINVTKGLLYVVPVEIIFSLDPVRSYDLQKIVFVFVSEFLI